MHDHIQYDGESNFFYMEEKKSSVVFQLLDVLPFSAESLPHNICRYIDSHFPETAFLCASTLAILVIS